jgi:tRNA pseudouridine55 synthase
MITKNQNNNNQPDFTAGEVILIDKDKGYSSFNIVHKIRRAVQVKKVGHAGTLDPAATGLLIVCTGKKTKEISSYQGMNKVYSGTITLGKRTSSMDGESEVTEEKSIDGITEELIRDTVKLFIGNIKQIPPMFSALKYKGKRLYKLARQGVEVERQPREVTIYRYDITKIDLPEVKFEVECSKGTYIRVLADDLGNKLGCGGYLSSLRRKKIGEYSVDNAFTINEFEALFDLRRNEKSDI